VETQKQDAPAQVSEVVVQVSTPTVQAPVQEPETPATPAPVAQEPVVAEEPEEEEVEYAEDSGINSFIIFLVCAFIIILGVFVFFSGTWYSKSRMAPTDLISPLACPTQRPILQ